MFEKLLANLPYNPELVHQINFYARRMRREESIRRTGLVFVVLAFLVQFVAFFAPPVTTAAYSNNDMINGGFSSKAQAVAACRNNDKHYQDVLWNFKITCADVANGTTMTLNSTDHDGQLYSFGWTSYGAKNPNNGRSTHETPFTLPKIAGNTIYARLLHSFDTLYPSSNYQVLRIQASDGTVYWLMYECGNLVSVGIPTPAKTCTANGQVYYAGAAECKKTTPPPSTTVTTPTPPPTVVTPPPITITTPPTPIRTANIVNSKTAANLTQNISNADGTTAQPSDVITYTLSAQNTGNANATGYVMQEDLTDVLEYADVVDLDGGSLNGNLLTWPTATIIAGTTLTHKVTVRVKNPVPNTAPPAGNPNSYDHIMTNVYGNAVNIRVATPIAVTTVAATSTSLPNTGPGAGIILAAAIAIVAGYFFARARLLVHESVLVMQESYSGTL